MAIDRDEMDRDEIAGMIAARRGGRGAVEEAPGSVSGAGQPGEAGAVRDQLERAARMMEREPDRAAWLLDAALRRMVSLWLARHGQEFQREPAAASEAEALVLIGRADPPLALQLDLARHASDARGRLRHCRAMLVLIERSDVGLEQADAGCGALRGLAEWAAPAERGQRAPSHNAAKR